MRYIKGSDSRQMTMGIWSIEEEVAANSPARFIEVFVDSLDMAALEIKRVKPAQTGRPPYAPQDLLKLYLYGYLNGIRSSRKLERECGRNIELFYLLNRLVPDHNTISDFRKDNKKALKKVFLIFVRACKDMKLMDAKTLCLDGTTIELTGFNNPAKEFYILYRLIYCGRYFDVGNLYKGGILFLMKRMLSLTLTLLLLCSYAFADPIGFGYKEG